MIDETCSVSLVDHESGEEIEGVNFPSVVVAPRVGEKIHYWQDGTAESVSGVPVRRDFLVRAVEHDWRYLPARGGGRNHYVHTLILSVEEARP